MGITKGARLMLSTPPAIISSASPDLMARAPCHRVHAGAAQAVDGGARHLDRQPGQQAGHARDVAVVLAGLVGAAVDHVAHGPPVELGVARHQCLDRHGGQVVGAHRGEGAAVASAGCRAFPLLSNFRAASSEDELPRYARSGSNNVCAGAANGRRFRRYRRSRAPPRCHRPRRRQPSPGRAREHRERLRAERAALMQCERQFAEAARELKRAFDLVGAADRSSRHPCRRARQVWPTRCSAPTAVHPAADRRLPATGLDAWR